MGSLSGAAVAAENCPQAVFAAGDYELRAAEASSVGVFEVRRSGEASFVLKFVSPNGRAAEFSSGYYLAERNREELEGIWIDEKKCRLWPGRSGWSSPLKTKHPRRLRSG